MASISTYFRALPASNHQRLVVTRGALLGAVLFIAGFLAVQRISLNPINAFVCVFPFLLSVYYFLKGKTNYSLSCLLLALVYSVDQGGAFYAETPSVLRYLIYLSALAMMLRYSSSKWNSRGLVLFTLILICVLVGTFSSLYKGMGAFGLDIFRIDFQTLFVIGIFTLHRRRGELDFSLVYIAGCGYLFGEIINASLFYNSNEYYLSFDSTKAFVFFPLLYVLMDKRHYIVQMMFILLTSYIVFLYGSRMLVLSAMLLFIAAILIGLTKSISRKIVIWAAFFLVLVFSANTLDLIQIESIAQFKAFGFLIVIMENISVDGVVQTFQALDPVRYGEHILFFSRPWFEIIFGSGLGSGLYDANGVLSFVTYDQTAFSESELATSTFYSFHDFWIDFGMRFGLLPVLVLVIRLSLFEMLQGRLWLGVLFGLLLVNTTFTISGIIMTAFVFRFSPLWASGVVQEAPSMDLNREN